MEEKNMKKITALLLVVLSVMMLLTSCGSTTPDAEPSGDNSGTNVTPAGGNTRATTTGREENTLYAAASAVPTTLDPEHFGLQVEDGIINQVYESLFRQKVSGELVLHLAEELTQNEDGSVSVTLRDAKFHSGDTLKTEDVIYTFSRLGTSTLNSALFGIVEIVEVDEKHFTMNFPYASQGADFTSLIPYLVNVRIENKSWAEQQISDVNDTITGLIEDGTGAYIFDSVSDGGDVTLKRFEDYWGEAHIDTIKFKYLTGDATIAFEAGDIDMTGYNASVVERARAYDNVDVYEVPGSSTTFLIIGSNEALVTSDLRVRQAIAYALNRKDVADAASQGSGLLAYNVAHPNVEYYTEDVEKFERDLDKSKQLMTEAGYSESNRAHINLITLGGNAPWVSACELVKANLEESYFSVDIVQLNDASRYFQADFEMGIINFSYFNTFGAWNILFDPTSGMDLAGYDGTKTGILDTFAAINDEASAQKAMREVVDTVAYYPLFYPVNYTACDSNLDLGPDFGEVDTFFKDFSWK